MPELQRMDSYAFKTALERGEAPEKAVVTKSGGFVEKAVDGQERTFRFTVSDDGRDRDNDTISPKGWDLAFFQANPVILFGHDHRTPPIGIAERVFVAESKLKEDIRFAEREHGELAEQVYKLVRDGFLRATSVGFIPREYERRDGDDEVGVDFTKQELIETSIVPVPSNPRALMEGRGFEPDPRGFLAAQEKGINVEPVRAWAERVLDLPDAERGGLDIRPLEKAWKLTWAGPVIVDLGREKGRGKAAEAKRVLSYNGAHEGGTPVADADAEWNGQREVAQASVDDLFTMAAWVAETEEGEEPAKTDFKLPHHRAEGDHPVVLRGVNAAMAALLGARGGVDVPDADRRGIYNHLARHLRDDFDREPPEFRGLTLDGFVKWVAEAFGESEAAALAPEKAAETIDKRTGEVFRDRVAFEWDAEREAAREVQVAGFFRDDAGKAIDEGRSAPSGMVSVEEAAFVVVRRPADGSAPGEILAGRHDGLDVAVAEARSQAVEAADPGLAFLVGEKVGEIPEESRAGFQGAEKRGRVLSRANENRIRKAVESLSEVLSALGEQPEEDGADAASEKEVDLSDLELAPDEKEIDLDEDELDALAERLVSRASAGSRSA